MRLPPILYSLLQNIFLKASIVSLLTWKFVIKDKSTNITNLFVHWQPWRKFTRNENTKFQSHQPDHISQSDNADTVESVIGRAFTVTYHDRVISWQRGYIWEKVNDCLPFCVLAVNLSSSQTLIHQNFHSFNSLINQNSDGKWNDNVKASSASFHDTPDSQTCWRRIELVNGSCNTHHRLKPFNRTTAWNYSVKLSSAYHNGPQNLLSKVLLKVGQSWN